MSEIKITDRISYLPEFTKPLSAEVGIVRGDSMTYIFDVGSNPATLKYLSELNGKCDIVVSHFHADHTWWLTKHKKGDKWVGKDDELSLIYERPAFRSLYIGSYTKRYIPDGKVVSEPETISSLNENESLPAAGSAPDTLPIYDGVKVVVFPIPNSHCKGSLAMMVDDEYVFLGDAIYCMEKNKKAVYNTQLLKAEIDLLKAIPAKTCLISHDKRFVRDKRVVLRQLEAVYTKKKPDSPFIEV